MTYKEDDRGLTEDYDQGEKALNLRLFKKYFASKLVDHQVTITRQDAVPEQISAHNFSFHHLSAILKMFVAMVKNFHYSSWLDPQMLEFIEDPKIKKTMTDMRLMIFQSALNYPLCLSSQLLSNSGSDPIVADRMREATGKYF